ncbi:MAG: hypothetical protein OEM02_04010 [Desulfobulbaceae bacterium]|nr:hypothetical protein [Desulfobulbaceae bacterium]
MEAIIEYLGSDLLCRTEHSKPGEIRRPSDEALQLLTQWASRYNESVRFGQDEELLLIGR